MEKIDLILYILIAMIALNVISKTIRSYNDFIVSGKGIYDKIRRDISKGNFAKAIELCESCLINKPYDSQLLWFQAEILFRTQQYKKALEKFEYILEHEPTWKEDAQNYIEAIQKKI